MTSPIVSIRAVIPSSAIGRGTDLARLSIWSVTETVIVTQTDLKDLTQIMHTTEREIAIGLNLYAAIKRLRESLALLAVLPQAVKETA